MKKIVIGVPVIDKHEMTGRSLSITASYVVRQGDITFTIIDNGSEKPYTAIQHSGGLKIDLISNKENLGFYLPLLQLYEKYPDAEYIGLMHNDSVIYKDGWDDKIREAFDNDPKLGVVGLYGWEQISKEGQNEIPFGNVYFPEVADAIDAQEAIAPSKPDSKRVQQLTPALIIDSLFMVFRREMIPLLGIDENITISHGYDKIWSLRLIEQGWRVAVLGVSFQHQGGNDKDPKIREMFKKWFDKRWAVNSPIEYVYDIAFFETQVLLINEFRDKKKMIPCRIDDKYNLIKL